MFEQIKNVEQNHNAKLEDETVTFSGNIQKEKVVITEAQNKTKLIHDVYISGCTIRTRGT